MIDMSVDLLNLGSLDSYYLISWRISIDCLNCIGLLFLFIPESFICGFSSSDEEFYSILRLLEWSILTL